MGYKVRGIAKCTGGGEAWEEEMWYTSTLALGARVNGTYVIEMMREL
jgi:hypothetical protein